MNKQDVIRKRNRLAVEKFFEYHGEQRAELFDEDGVKELTYAANGDMPQRWEGRAEVLTNFIANKTFFTNWRWRDVVIDETQDENKFWVEAFGGGEQKVGSSAVATKYENHYIFCFRMKDGYILEMREINNPLNLMKALGISLPKMPDAKKDTEQLIKNQKR